MTVIQPSAASRQAGRALLATTVVGEGSQLKRTRVAGAQRDGTKISAANRFWSLSRE